MIDQGVVEGSPEAWLDALPSYHGKKIRGMVNAGVGLEEIAQAFLSGIGPADNAPYGVVDQAKSNYWLAVKKEVGKFICGDPGYADLRKQVEAGWEKGKTWIVGAVAAFIASNIGVAAAVILPVVGIALALVARVGVKAWCEVNS